MSEPLQIVVCVKQVPDPESPPSSFTLDSSEMRVTCSGVPPVLSPFDENALELAIALKELHGAEVTIVSAGRGLSKAVLLKALAVGADKILVVDDEALARDKVDSRQTALVLASAISDNVEKYDLVLTGIQAADTNAGQVGHLLGCMLGIPVLSLVRKVELSDGAIRVERVLADGCEVVEAGLPVLLTVSHEVGELRYPSLAAIKAAKGLPQTTLSLADLGVDLGSEKSVDLVSLELPDRERRCQMVEAEEPELAGAALAARLVEDKKLTGFVR